MKIRLLNLLLIGGVVSSIVLSSCSKDNDDNKPSEGINPPINETSGTFIDNRDSTSYEWIKIGEQVWMAENLAYTGNNLQHITNDNDWANNSNYDGWCYYNNNDSLGHIYGVLYQYEAAKIACPEGWHLPTYEEWTELENYLKENGYSYDGIIGNPYVAKSLATSDGWLLSDIQGAVGNPDFSEYRNKAKFYAIPSGLRFDDGYFANIGGDCGWWTATQTNNEDAYSGGFSHYDNQISCVQYHKYFGFSVRCIKD